MSTRSINRGELPYCAGESLQHPPEDLGAFPEHRVAPFPTSNVAFTYPPSTTSHTYPSPPNAPIQDEIDGLHGVVPSYDQFPSVANHQNHFGLESSTCTEKSKPSATSTTLIPYIPGPGVYEARNACPEEAFIMQHPLTWHDSPNGARRAATPQTAFLTTPIPQPSPCSSSTAGHIPCTPLSVSTATLPALSTTAPLSTSSPPLTMYNLFLSPPSDNYTSFPGYSGETESDAVKISQAESSNSLHALPLPPLVIPASTNFLPGHPVATSRRRRRVDPSKAVWVTAGPINGTGDGWTEQLTAANIEAVAVMRDNAKKDGKRKASAKRIRRHGAIVTAGSGMEWPAVATTTTNVSPGRKRSLLATEDGTPDSFSEDAACSFSRSSSCSTSAADCAVTHLSPTVHDALLSVSSTHNGLEGSASSQGTLKSLFEEDGYQQTSDRLMYVPGTQTKGFSLFRNSINTLSSAIDPLLAFPIVYVQTLTLVPLFTNSNAFSPWLILGSFAPESSAYNSCDRFEPQLTNPQTRQPTWDPLIPSKVGRSRNPSPRVSERAVCSSSTSHQSDASCIDPKNHTPSSVLSLYHSGNHERHISIALDGLDLASKDEQSTLSVTALPLQSLPDGSLSLRSRQKSCDYPERRSTGDSNALDMPPADGGRQKEDRCHGKRRAQVVRRQPTLRKLSCARQRVRGDDLDKRSGARASSRSGRSVKSKCQPGGGGANAAVKGAVLDGTPPITAGTRTIRGKASLEATPPSLVASDEAPPASSAVSPAATSPYTNLPPLAPMPPQTPPHSLTASVQERRLQALALKRARNTDAARRSRQRKLKRLEALEKEVAALDVENRRLAMELAVSENEFKNWKTKEHEYKDRIAFLENRLLRMATPGHA